MNKLILTGFAAALLAAAPMALKADVTIPVPVPPFFLPGVVNVTLPHVSVKAMPVVLPAPVVVAPAARVVRPVRTVAYVDDYAVSRPVHRVVVVRHAEPYGPVVYSHRDRHDGYRHDGYRQDGCRRVSYRGWR